MRTLWRIFAGFFKWTWRLLNFVRNLVMNIFFIFLVLVCAGIWMHISNANQSQHSTRGALLLDITGVIVDKPSTSNRLGVIGRQLFGATSDRLQENSLFDIVETIRQAKDDRNITGIVLDLKDFAGADQPSMQYIGKALREFRDSGKPVIAIGDSYTQGQYYLASFANKIWLSPQGAVDLHGFATNGLYYKSLLDKLKVTTHVFRVGTYKSAVEPFIRDDMSPAAREADSRWIGELWQNYLGTIAANRQITAEQVFPGARGVLDGLRKVDGDTAKYALDNKLVDQLGSSAEIEKALTKQFGWSKEDKNYSAISMYDYAAKKPDDSGDSIAVVFANGAIMDGEETPGNVGGDTTASQIRDARLDPKVKAIVLRVNSPGGSVTASEVIRAELAAARAAGKPVVVSMGGMAAFIPSKDAERNNQVLNKVKADKELEARNGHDGTWIAHPGLADTAMEVFNRVLGDNKNQLFVTREDDAPIAEEQLLAPCAGERTEEGMRANIRVAVQYIEAWISGNGCVPIYGLMEDAATAEISRTSIWQWIHHQKTLSNGKPVTKALFRQMLAEEMRVIQDELGEHRFSSGRFDDAARLMEQITTSDDLIDFLTLPGYRFLA